MHSETSNQHVFLSVVLALVYPFLQGIVISLLIGLIRKAIIAPKLAREISVLRSDCDSQMKKLRKYHSQNKNAYLWLPEKYQNSFCVDKIYEALNSRRVETLNEAFDMCDVEVRHMEMMNKIGSVENSIINKIDELSYKIDNMEVNVDVDVKVYS